MLPITKILIIFAGRKINERIMTIEQLKALYSELFRNLSIIAEDENKQKRLAKYLRKLVKEKENN